MPKTIMPIFSYLDEIIWMLCNVNPLKKIYGKMDN